MPSRPAIASPHRQPSLPLLTGFAGACLLSWLLGGSQALAQPSVEPGGGAQDDDFFEVVNVNIANIDVWVTDKEGDPVGGLGKDDFVVTRDGRPVEVANFYAVYGDRPASTRSLAGENSDPRRRTPLRPLDPAALDREPAQSAKHRPPPSSMSVAVPIASVDSEMSTPGKSCMP